MMLKLCNVKITSVTEAIEKQGCFLAHSRKQSGPRRPIEDSFLLHTRGRMQDKSEQGEGMRNDRKLMAFHDRCF